MYQRVVVILMATPQPPFRGRVPRYRSAIFTRSLVLFEAKTQERISKKSGNSRTWLLTSTLPRRSNKPAAQ